MTTEDQQIERRLNLAGRFTKAFIQSKLTPLIIICTIIFGAAALKYTPRTYNPEIVVPAVNILISRPGSNSTEMLNQVVRPVEALMASIPGVDHTYGIAVDDHALVNVKFDVGSNEEDSLVKLYNQVNSNLDKMPSGTLTPFIQSVSLYDVPLITITLSSSKRNSMELRDIALRILENLRNTPSVGKSWISGSSPQAVHVWIDSKKLTDYFIPLQEINASLTRNNVAYSTGRLEGTERIQPIRVVATLMNPEEVGNIMIGVFNGRPVYIKDVATIDVSPIDEDIQSFFAFGPGSVASEKAGRLETAVTISIARQKGSDGVKIASEILDRFEILKKSQLPDDITATITRDYGFDADEAVNKLLDHLTIAIIAVVIVLWIFLGWREASIVAVSIPLILSIVLGISWVFGFTMNRVTIFSLILTLGLLVDDSIVVIENIHRHMLIGKAKSFASLIINAANEIGIPTIVATFTVISALLPLIYITGMMGAFVAPIPFNAPIAMLISLLIAYTVVPYLSNVWLKGKATRIHVNEVVEQSHPDNFIYRFYESSMGNLIASPTKRHKFYFYIVLSLILVCLLPAWQFIKPSGLNTPISPFSVEFKMLPDDNVNTFLIEVDTAAGTASLETFEVTKAISSLLAKNPNITDYQIFLGQAAPQDFAAMIKGDYARFGTDFAQIRVNLINKHHRKIGSHEIVQNLYKELDQVRTIYPTAIIKLFETPPGPPMSSQMQAAIYGPDYEELRRIAEYLTQDIYPKVYGMINVDNSVTENIPEYRVKVDQNKAIASGFLPNLIADDMHSYFAGKFVGHVHTPESRETRDIFLKLPLRSRHDVDAIKRLLMVNHIGQAFPLMKVATIEEVIQHKPIYTRDQYPVVFVSGEMLRSSPVYAVLYVTKQLDGMPIGEGMHLTVDNLGLTDKTPDNIVQYQMDWLGEMRLTLDVLRDLASIYIVTLITIFVLLVAVYRSFMLPVIIMGAIPLTIIGVFPGHWITHQPFTATSMIGVIALAGIVVRNSLLLIDFIIHRQKDGVALDTAVLHSGLVRLLPILLTALAIILGSSVMVTDPIFGGLAVSLIFGAFASTVLSLYFIPLIYLDWHKRFIERE